MLARLGEEKGFSAEAVLARRASVLNALGRSTEALADIAQALALWQRLAPAGQLNRIELFDVLASIQARLGDHRSAEETARRALALVVDRDQIEPAQLARIEALAGTQRFLVKRSEQ
ncbi:MAG: tetratricopeptide repeat protein [Dokdonella sp.]